MVYQIKKEAFCSKQPSASFCRCSQQAAPNFAGYGRNVDDSAAAIILEVFPDSMNGIERSS